MLNIGRRKKIEEPTNLRDAGIDASSKKGAHILADNIRDAWLRKGFDVKVDVVHVKHQYSHYFPSWSPVIRWETMRPVKPQEAKDTLQRYTSRDW